MNDTATDERPSLPRRAISYFDPAREGFVRRMARLAAGLAVATLCPLALAGLLAMRSETGRYFTVYMLTRSGAHERALPLAEALVEDYPNANWHYYRLKALNLRHLGRYEESLAVYDDAIAVMPDEWWAHSHRCFYNSLLADPAPVMDSCDTSIELDPTDPGIAHDRRAFARALVGDREGAIYDFEIALEHIPEWANYSASQIEARRTWLEALRAGEDPLTEAELRRELANY